MECVLLWNVVLFVAVTSTTESAMGVCGNELRGHYLSGEFATLLLNLSTLLPKCTEVHILKNFLKLYSHPLYPEKLYVEPHVYRDAETAIDVIFCLIPKYINFMNHYLLQEIVNRFGDDECKKSYEKYQETFRRSGRKLKKQLLSMDDEEADSRVELKVSLVGDVNNTTPSDVHTVQEAIMQVTGISRAGQMFTRQDPGNSVMFTFLIPCSFVQLFHELSNADLIILADAGIKKIHVDKFEVTVVKKHMRVFKTGLIKLSPTVAAAFIRERKLKLSHLMYYLAIRHDFSSLQRSELKTLLIKISSSKLNEVCSEDLLHEFSASIKEWRALAPFFGMPDYYYNDFTCSVTEQNYQLLLFWKRREGRNAKYGYLLELIVLHGKADEAKALISIPLMSEF